MFPGGPVAGCARGAHPRHLALQAVADCHLSDGLPPGARDRWWSLDRAGTGSAVEGRGAGRAGRARHRWMHDLVSGAIARRLSGGGGPNRCAPPADDHRVPVPARRLELLPADADGLKAGSFRVLVGDSRTKSFTAVAADAGGPDSWLANLILVDESNPSAPCAACSPSCTPTRRPRSFSMGTERTASRSHRFDDPWVSSITSTKWSGPSLRPSRACSRSGEVGRPVLAAAPSCLTSPPWQAVPEGGRDPSAGGDPGAVLRPWPHMEGLPRRRAVLEAGARCLGVQGARSAGPVTPLATATGSWTSTWTGPWPERR